MRILQKDISWVSGKRVGDFVTSHGWIEGWWLPIHDQLNDVSFVQMSDEQTKKWFEGRSILGREFVWIETQCMERFPQI